MGVDESFSEYVVARWSALHRLATLLAGPGDADALAHDALVQVYLAWTEIRAASSPDTEVRRMLVRVATEVPRAAPRAPALDADQAGDVWDQFCALPPHQRAILVLRHHEGLSDAEIGEALRRPADVVAADAFVWETRSDPADLRDVLSQHSDAVRAPLPPLDRVLASGREERRRRRRRTARWTAAAAAALALVLAGASVVQHDAGPPPASETPAVAPFLAMLPSGQPPRIAYTVGRSLHLGSGDRIALDEAASSLVQTSKWLYVSSLSGAIVRVDAVRGTVLPVARASRGELATDPSGQHVVWLAAGPGPAVVVLRTAWDWGVLLSDRQRFPAEPRCCDDPFVLNGITRGGEVIGSLPVANRAWVWSTPDAGSDTAVREISGLDGGAIMQVVADGVVVRRPSGTYAVGSVLDGVFRPVSVLAAKQADFADPFRRRVVYVDDAGEIHVREWAVRGRSRRPQDDVRLRLPTQPTGFAAVRWEDPDHVLLDLADPSVPHGALVRCDVATGGCEVAVRFDGPHLLAG
jgi:DNA-directed RNA polymerase specialized sigma24 family protein